METRTQENLDGFAALLAVEYHDLFKNDPAYAYSAEHITPEALGRKMALALDAGTGNKDGKAVRRDCEKLGVPYTYKGIRAHLSAK